MSTIMISSMVADDVPRYARAAVESLAPEDFETASIRSAAPSYTSDAPSYHSTNPHPDPLPAYSPPAHYQHRPQQQQQQQQPRPTAPARNGSVSSLLDPDAPYYGATTTSSLTPTPTHNSTTTAAAGSTPRRHGLPPVPSGPIRQQPDLPSLTQFRIPPWSTAAGASNNPTARLYQNVALRRASAASSSSTSLSSSSSSTSSSSFGGASGGGYGYGAGVGIGGGGGGAAAVLERIEEEERLSGRDRVRPLEDPYLVGEEAAARARAERMARESVMGGSGDEILVREDRRWDWFLAQMRDREERERSWKRFRREMDKRNNSRLAFRIGARF